MGFYEVTRKVRELGIEPRCIGIKYIIDILDGRYEIEDLSENQKKEIIYAWDSAQNISKEKNDKIRPFSTQKIRDNSFYSIIVENIINFFKS